MSQEWIRLPVELLKSKTLSPVECVVLAVLLDKCESSEAELNMKDLCEYSNTSRSTMLRTLKKLQAEHLITIAKRSGDISSYKVSPVLPPKKRGSKQAVLDAELKDLRKQAEVQKLKKQLQADDDVSKYEAVINKF